MSRPADPTDSLRSLRPSRPPALSNSERGDLLARILLAAREESPRSARSPRLTALPLAAILAATAIVAVVIGLGTRGAPDATAAAEQRLRGVAIVATESGARLDTGAATIFGSANTPEGTVYLVTGFRLVDDESGQCIGLLAGRPLDDSFSRLPDSSLYFGDYSCGASAGTLGVARLGDGVFLWGRVADASTTRVMLEGPGGRSQLPLRNGIFGTVAPFEPRPARIAEYDAAGSLTHSWPLGPRAFAKGYKSPDQTSPHHTLIGATLPGGTPVGVERSDGEDQFGSYAYWISIDGRPAQGTLAQWEPTPGEPARPADFLTATVLTAGGSRLVLIDRVRDVSVTARLDDGTAVPLDFHALSATSSLALVVLSGGQLDRTLTISGQAADGTPLGSDMIDLAGGVITAQHRPRSEAG